MKTAGEKERDRHGGYLPIVAAAIRHRVTGEITRGADHEACLVSAYRIATGDTRSAGVLRRKWCFVDWLEANRFEVGFCNTIGMFFNRVNATQIVCRRLNRLCNVAQMSCKEILSVGMGVYKEGGALPPFDVERGDIDVEVSW